MDTEFTPTLSLDQAEIEECLEWILSSNTEEIQTAFEEAAQDL